ncbi:hypothetical protein AB0J94_32085 [Micromonospora noduli]|uniref:hypothetical protein n=1 Tax=Micromonospora noduli TaxID=709876 RepID=UPI0034211BC5
MATSARQRVAAFWDTHIAEWLSGEDPSPSPLPEWFRSYKRTGPGRPTLDGFPEPYHGDLLGLKHTPRVVVLGLNPGEYQRQFQSRNGIVAKEIEQFVWQPIGELPVRDVFAFGRSWHVLAKTLKLTETGAFDAGGPGYGSSAAGRKVQTHALTSGQRLVVVWQPGYAGPPSAEETDLLRDALSGAPSVVGGGTRPVPGARASSNPTLDPTSAGQRSS